MAAINIVSIFIVFFLFVDRISVASSQSVIKLSQRSPVVILDDDLLYCDSWRFSVETNDAGFWATVPARCKDYVVDYLTGIRFQSDSEFVAADSLAFAKSVEMDGNGDNAWIFDIDETLLSNLPYYGAHGFGSEVFDEKSFDDWVNLAVAPALPSSLGLYKELQELGFKIVLLTGRSEFQRNATEQNLRFSGYTNWEKLILRGPLDQNIPATVYKSEKRSELVNQGYTIYGNSGDQWSDLTGFALARRSFKLPNPLYCIA